MIQDISNALNVEIIKYIPLKNGLVAKNLLIKILSKQNGFFMKMKKKNGNVVYVVIIVAKVI
jgi:hypothetical protein